MTFTEDLSPFFNVEDFADEATLDGDDVAGIFDGDYIDPLDVESSGPVFMLATSSTSGVAHGSDLVIAAGHGAGTYKVRGVKPDGTGVTVLKLEVQ